MRGQQPILINDFRGLYDRGPNENCPLNYFIDCQNVEFFYKGFRTRGGFTVGYNFTAVAGDIIGIYGYPRLDGTTRRLLLVRSTGGATPVKLYDIDHASAPPFLVAEYATDVDSVSVISLYDRLYIAALTTKNEHKAGAFVQVYDGLTAARNAAGVAPAGAAMVATEPGAGNVEAGIHLYAVAFETPSGHITKMGPPVWTNFTSAGNKNINLAGVPLGPAGTVKRYILATKVIPAYGPPQENFELFFVDEINDNVTTTITIDFFDSELVNSADYLQYQYETIPAGPLFMIGNSLGIAGYKTDATPAGNKTSVALISKAADVEAFAVDTGFVVVKPSLGGPLRNGLDLNGTLYFFKDSLTAAIQPDLDSEPSEWGSPGVIDSIIGTTPHGIATYMGAPFIINGGAFIITKFGLQHFNGSYNNLGYVIDERWIAVTNFDFNTSIATVDPIQRRVYIFIPTVPGYPNLFYACDYKDGFTAESVRWSPWVVTNAVLKGMFTDRDGLLQIANISEEILVYTKPSPSAARPENILTFAETSKLRFSDTGHVQNMQMVLLGAEGTGNMQLDWFSKDAIISDLATPDIALAFTPDRLFKRLANFSSQLISMKLTTLESAGSWMSISSLTFFGHVEAEEYPE